MRWFLPWGLCELFSVEAECIKSCADVVCQCMAKTDLAGSDAALNEGRTSPCPRPLRYSNRGVRGSSRSSTPSLDVLATGHSKVIARRRMFSHTSSIIAYTYLCQAGRSCRAHRYLDCQTRSPACTVHTGHSAAPASSLLHEVYVREEKVRSEDMNNRSLAQSRSPSRVSGHGVEQ